MITSELEIFRSISMCLNVLLFKTIQLIFFNSYLSKCHSIYFVLLIEFNVNKVVLIYLRYVVKNKRIKNALFIELINNKTLLIEVLPQRKYNSSKKCIRIRKQHRHRCKYLRRKNTVIRKLRF